MKINVSEIELIVFTIQSLIEQIMEKDQVC